MAKSKADDLPNPFVRERLRGEALDVRRAEMLDPVPMAPPVGYLKQPSMIEQIRNMVRGEHVRLAALQAGAETFEESDDFDVGDDFDPDSPYEEHFDPLDYDARMRLRQEDYERKLVERMNEYAPNRNGDSDGNEAGSREQSRSVKGREDDTGGGSRRSDPRDKDDSGAKSDAADE